MRRFLCLPLLLNALSASAEPLAGRVTLHSGDPAPGAIVSAEMLGRWGASNPTEISTPADPDGTFTLEVPRDGRYALTVTVAGRASVTF